MVAVKNSKEMEVEEDMVKQTKETEVEEDMVKQTKETAEKPKAKKNPVANRRKRNCPAR